MRLLAALALVPLLVAGCSANASDAAVSDAPAPRAPAVEPLPPGPVPSFRSARDVPERRAVPVRLRIPDLAVDAPVGPVGLRADGSVDVPRRWEDVGWFDQGQRPGEDGPVVLLGHVDSKTGPAVFARLAQAVPGTPVEVTSADGSTTRFRVDRLQVMPKTSFPTDEVYLPALSPQLRLVTCGGEFDRRSGHYRDNVVVYASPLP